MGIRGLQGIMEKGDCPGGSKRIKIQDFVDEYRAKNGTRAVPTIVVDGCGCIRKLYGDLCWVMGGQWKEYLRILEDFVEKFRKLGIKLVFFFDGPTMPEKRATWNSRRLQNMETTKQVFATIRNRRVPIDDHFHLPTGMTVYTRMALKFVCKCEVFNSRRECDEEIAAYAKKKNYLAILAQDSDYIIFDTVPYLSMLHLDLLTMTTVQYDRRALASWLGLRISQLPLVASLCGNDTISFDSLKNFRYYLNNGSTYVRNFGVYIKTLAEFIRMHWKSGSDPDLVTMAKIVFIDDRKAELLKRAIAAYDTNYHEPKLLLGVNDMTELVTSRHANCENVSFVFTVLFFASFDCSNALEEHKTVSGFPPASLLYRAVRQRCYHIIQSARNPNERIDFIEEWCAYPGNPLTAPEKVQSMPCRLPSGDCTLRALWLSQPSSTSTHLEAFLTCFGVAFEYTVDYVPQKYLIFCCITNYLLRNTKIAEWQIDALIAQAIILNSTSVEFIQRLKIFEYIAEAVNLAALFMNGVTTALIALCTCSHPIDMKSAMPWNYFDGKLFHRCYALRMATASPNYTDGNMKPIDSRLFDAIKRMCLSKKRLG